MASSTIRDKERISSGIESRSKRSIAARYSLHAVAFLSGAIVLLLEVLASRILGPYLGTSFSVWVNIIGTILAALSAGYFMGGILADRNQKLLPHIFLAAAAACSFVYVGRPLLPLLGALGLTWGSLVAAILFFAPASVILGMVSPYLLKLASNDPTQLGRTSGGIFAASTLGSLAGTFVGGFWLIPYFPISYILAGMIALLLGLSLWCGVGLRPYWVISVAVLALTSLGSQLITFSAPKHTIFEKNSKYYDIRINDIQREGDGAPLRWLLLDGSTQGARYRDSLEPAMPYADLSMRIIRSLKPSPESALALGGGAYSIPEQIKRYSPDTKVTVVEIDPEVTKIAKRFFLNDPAVPITTINEDARVFLNTNQRQFDLVYTDVYSSGYAVPPALSSREAFQRMRRALKPDGIVVLNLFSAREGELALVYQALYQTISEVFPGIAVYTTKPDSADQPQNIIMIASNDKTISEDALPEFLRRYRCRTHPAPGILLTDDYAPTDYLVHNLVRAIYPGQRSVQ